MGVVRLHPAQQHKPVTIMPTKNVILVTSQGIANTRTRRTPAERNYSVWGGGSTTVVTPDGNNGDVILAELECVPSVVKYKVNTESTPRPRAIKRKAEEEQEDPEEDEKRKIRRKRNRSLEEEVVARRAEKEELNFLLAAHR